MSNILIFLWFFGSIGLICYSACKLSIPAFMLGAISIFAFIALAISSQAKYNEAFDEKCQAAGGQTLEYHAYHRSTQLSCVKKDSVIEIN